MLRKRERKGEIGFNTVSTSCIFKSKALYKYFSNDFLVNIAPYAMSVTRALFDLLFQTAPIQSSKPLACVMWFNTASGSSSNSSGNEVAAYN